MVALKEIPLFKSLPKVELAKLIPDVQVVHLEKGTVLNVGEKNRAVYFVHDGWVELIESTDENAVPLLPLGPGEAFGCLTASTGTPMTEQVRAQTSCVLVRVPKERFDQVCSVNPTLARGLSDLMARRLSLVHAELSRTRRMLNAYAVELWDNPYHDLNWTDAAATTEGSGAQTSAACAEEIITPFAGQPSSAMSARKWLRQSLNVCIVSSIIGVMLWSRITNASPAVIMLVLLGWGALNWFANTMPDYAVGLALVSTTAIMGLVKPAVAFSGFSNPTWLLSLGVYGIGAAIQRSGLLYRFALFMLRHLPPTYWGQTLALALTGLILTPALPSANGRVTIASPLAAELAEAMRLPGQSEGSMGLALACHHGFGQMFFLFMNGTGSCLMVWGLLPPAIRSQVTWWAWFAAALPMGAVVFLGFYAWLLRLGRRHTNDNLVDHRVLDMQMRALGPMSRSEIATLVVTLSVLLGFMTQGWHHLDPAWPAISGLLALLGLGVVDKVTFRTNIDWSYLIFFGVLISLADVIKGTGLESGMEHAVTLVLHPLANHAGLFFAGLVLLTYLVRIAIPWPSTVLLMMVAIMPVAIGAGYSPFIAGLVLLAASNPWFLPHQNTVYLNVFAGTNEEAFTHKQAMPHGWFYAALTLLAVLVSVPYWQWLKWLP